MSTTLTARPVSSIDSDTLVEAVDWASASTHVDDHGWAMVEKLMTANECETIAGLYDDDGRFRSHVVMAQHGFGRGEYKYFSYPLPDIVADLRRAIYPNLAPIANRWNESMGIDVRYPDARADFIARCHKAGQTRPTPLLLQYAAGDYALDAREPVLSSGFPTPQIVLTSGTGKRRGKAPTGGRSSDGKRLIDAEIAAQGNIAACFEDGRRVTGDLLIGCDGVHSITRQIIDSNAPTRRHVGLVNFGGYSFGQETSPLQFEITESSGRRPSPR